MVVVSDYDGQFLGSGIDRYHLGRCHLDLLGSRVVLLLTFFEHRADCLDEIALTPLFETVLRLALFLPCAMTWLLILGWLMIRAPIVLQNRYRDQCPSRS